MSLRTIVWSPQKRVAKKLWEMRLEFLYGVSLCLGFSEICCWEVEKYIKIKKVLHGFDAFKRSASDEQEGASRRRQGIKTRRQGRYGILGR